MSQDFVIGAKTAIYFTVMPDELLALPEIIPPVDVVITVSEAIEADEDELTVTALTGPVPAGTPIELSVTVATVTSKMMVFTREHARTGATTLKIEKVKLSAIVRAMRNPQATTFPSGSTGTYVAKLLFEGGTSSQEQIQNQNTETKTYKPKGLAFATGAITGSSWNISYDFNVLPTDEGYYRLNWCALHALGGAHGWLWKEDPAPAGYTKGESISGLVQIENRSKTNPADGIITGQTNFLGREEPITEPYS